MKKAMLCGLLLLISASMLQAAPVVVTFDDLGDGLVPSPYGGINWMGNWLSYADIQPPYNPETPPTRIYTNYALFPVGAFMEDPFTFYSPVVFDGAYFAGGNNLGVYFNLYLGGILVSTSSTLMQTSTPTFLASGYSGLVDKVGVVGYDGYYVMDNVTYNGAVPEPASLLLLGIGFGVVGLASRRRKL